MKFFTDDKRLFSKVIVPRHMGGWNRIAHGGIIATILDETMGWAGMLLTGKVVIFRLISAI